MGQADRDRAPGASRRAADPRHQAHQHEIGELGDVRHGDRIGPLDAAQASALHEFEMVGGKHGVKAGEVPQPRLQIRSIGQEIAKRIAGEASPRPMFKGEIAVAGDTRGHGESVGELLQRDPGKMVVNPLGRQPGFLENWTMLDTIVPQ